MVKSSYDKCFTCDAPIVMAKGEGDGWIVQYQCGNQIKMQEHTACSAKLIMSATTKEDQENA